MRLESIEVRTAMSHGAGAGWVVREVFLDADGGRRVQLWGNRKTGQAFKTRRGAEQVKARILRAWNEREAQ